jgi:hypothetical protein
MDDPAARGDWKATLEGPHYSVFGDRTPYLEETAAPPSAGQVKSTGLAQTIAS